MVSHVYEVLIALPTVKILLCGATKREDVRITEQRQKAVSALRVAHRRLEVCLKSVDTSKLFTPSDPHLGATMPPDYAVPDDPQQAAARPRSNTLSPFCGQFYPSRAGEALGQTYLGASAWQIRDQSG